MKLVYLSQSRLPTKNAHGFQIMNMCHALAVSGVEVCLLVPQRRNSLKENPFRFYALPETFEIKKLPVLDFFPFKFIPERVSILLLQISFLVSGRIYLWFRKYDLLYTRESWAGLFFRNFIFEVHMPEQLQVLGFRPQKLVTISQYIKERFLALGWSEDRILVAPDAVDLSKFPKIGKEDARNKLGLPLDKNIILYWGNFKKWKGVDTLAEAAKLLSDSLVYLIGGTKDSDVARIRGVVEGLENIFISGFKDQSETPGYLASADVLILPNTAMDDNSQFFTSPMKLFEYMAAERPIVASAVPSLREILDESSAFFFTPDSSESLAETIKLVLANADEAVVRARKARLDVERYTWEKRAQKVLEFINNG